MKKNRYLKKCIGMVFILFLLSQSNIITGLNINDYIVLKEIQNDGIFQNYPNTKYIGLIQKSIIYVGGSGPGNYTGIQDAINNAKYGDIVFVYGSSNPYYEHIFINTSIDLIGENQQTTIIDGLQYGSVIQIQSDLVNISGFTIQQSGYSFFSEWDSGVVCRGVQTCNIFNNIIINNYVGIYVTLSNNISIKNNKIFSDNMASDGIICSFSYDIAIVNNILGISSNTQRDALYFSQVTNSIVVSNYIFNYQNGLRLFRSHFITIQKNLLFNNQMFGIQMQNSGNNYIQNNIIHSSYFGIIVSYSPQSTENYIRHNDFIDNIYPAFFVELNSGKTIWFHNFWDESTILPKAIIGFYRDATKIQTELAFPIIAFDKKPNYKLNNADNNDLTYNFNIKLFNRSFKKNFIISSILYPTKNKFKETSINFKKEYLLKIKQSNESIRDIKMEVGDIIFMDCKRYNPAHSRPTNYSDHVALYIGNDPITNEKMFVDTVDKFGPRICNLSDFERWAHHFALGRVTPSTEEQRIGAVTWAKQLVLERNKPFSDMGDVVFNNYQYLPADYDLFGCWKTSLLDGYERYSQFWYCSELVWAAYYNINDEGNLDLYQEYSQRIDLDPSGWKMPFVVTAYEIFNDDNVKIYYKEPIL